MSLVTCTGAQGGGGITELLGRGALTAVADCAFTCSSIEAAKHAACPRSLTSVAKSVRKGFLSAAQEGARRGGVVGEESPPMHRLEKK